MKIFTLIVLQISMYSLSAFAGVRCEGLQAIHAGTRLYLDVKTHRDAILDLYLVKGHRGGGSFRQVGSFEVEMFQAQDGAEQIISGDGKTFIEISSRKDESGHRVGRIHSEQFNEDLFCSVWEDRN